MTGLAVFLVVFVLIMDTSVVYAARGCCSMHGGVAGCDQVIDRLVCNDGTRSPSCSCQGFEPPSPTISGQSRPPVQLGKDISVGNQDGRPVHIEHLRQGIKDTFGTITDVWKEHSLPTPTITSGNDRIHPGSDKESTDCSTETRCRQTSDSGHYQDRAIDLRSNNVKSDELKRQMVDELRKSLQSKGYSVNLEYPGQSQEHFHVQYNRSRTHKTTPSRSNP